MEITWITSRHYPDKGGMAVSSQRLVNSLLDRGHKVHIIHLTETKKQAVNSFKSNIHIQSRFSQVDCSPDNIAEYFWLNREQITKTILVGFGGGQAGHLATLWSKWIDTASLVMFRGNDFEKGIHSVKTASNVRFILDNADIVTTVSKEMAQRIQSLRQGLTIFIANSIDVSEWLLLDHDISQAAQWRKDNAIGQKPVIAMFGQLKAKKGLSMAVDLFLSYHFREKAYLLTVGDVPKKMRHSLSDDSGFWKHVRFKDRHSLPAMYACADLVFIPSIYDGMPNVLLEAMAMKRIVVASRAGGNPDVIHDSQNGFLFDIGDCDGAAKAIQKAIELDDEGRNTIADNARKTIQENFTPAIESQILEEALTSLTK